MQFFLIIQIISLFIFLFCTYVLTREDFMLLRKNINLEQIFNIAFIGLFISLIFARGFYIFLNPAKRFLNPLVILLFPYFPGLSLAGGIVGEILYFIYLSRKKKIPAGRLLDIFSLSFLLSLSSYTFLSQIFLLITKKHVDVIALLGVIVYIVGFIIFSSFFSKGKWKDGFASISVLLLYTIVTLVGDGLNKMHKVFLLWGREDIIVICLLLVGVSMWGMQKRGKARK